MSAGAVFATRQTREAGMQLLRDGGADVTVWPGPADASPPHAEILAGVREADVLLSLLTEQIDREVLRANPGLLGVANYAVGYDNIDVAAATELGIPVSNTPGVLTDTTADTTWTLLLAVARNVVAGDRTMREGRFGSSSGAADGLSIGRLVGAARSHGGGPHPVKDSFG